MKRLAVELENNLFTKVKMEALQQEKSTKQFITELIETYFQRKKEQTQ